MRKNLTRILAAVNRVYSPELDLDFAEGKNKSKLIIEALRPLRRHQGYKKYMAQVQAFSSRNSFLKNILSVPVIVTVVTILAGWSFIKPPKPAQAIETVYVTAGHPLLESFSERHARMFGIQDYCFANQFVAKMYLDKTLARYIMGLLVDHPYLLKNSYLLLFILIKLSIYNAMTTKHRPRHVYFYNERSFVGPFVTEYFNGIGVEVNLIMHGYRTFDVKDAFLSYNKAYVFGKYFMEMFVSMGCSADEFIMMGHPSLDSPPSPSSRLSQDLRVLLVLQQSVVISQHDIVCFLKLLNSTQTDFSLVVKPKPNYPNWLARHLPDLSEEKGRTNRDVLEDYEVFCGVHSTYLLEAWAFGKKVILLGNNALPKDLISGPNVLRLTLEEGALEVEKKQLHEFLKAEVAVDWNMVGRVFANKWVFEKGIWQ